VVVSGWLSSSWVVVIAVVIVIVVVVVVVVVVCDGGGDDVGDVAACSGIEAQMPRFRHRVAGRTAQPV
jgi:preprotein translocase subunit SecG